MTDSKMIDSDFIPSYDWIAAELHRVVVNIDDQCSYPVWAWKCWDSSRSCRPDLRTRLGSKKNEKLVLMKLDVPSHHVLLSDYDLWHYALNGWYLPINEQDQVNFEGMLQKRNIKNKNPYPEPYHSMVVNSWKRIFSWRDLDPDFHGESLGSSIQAVFWELKESLNNLAEFWQRQVFKF